MKHLKKVSANSLVINPKLDSPSVFLSNENKKVTIFPPEEAIKNTQI